jgi:hypothetical protein
MAQEYTTTTGYEIKIRNVPHLVMEKAANKIPVPVVPTYFNESKKEIQENPNDPEYIEALQNYEDLRQQAMFDAMISFGVQTGAKPPHKNTLKKELKEMDEAIGGGLLDGYNLDSDRDLDILWKRYYVLGAAVDLMSVQKYAVVQWEAVRKALESFRTSEEG